MSVDVDIILQTTKKCILLIGKQAAKKQENCQCSIAEVKKVETK